MENTLINNSANENLLEEDAFIKTKPISKKNSKTSKEILDRNFLNPIWVSISEGAKLGGIKSKTIRRAIQSKTLKYKITGSKYYVELSSLILYLHTKTKLLNKLNQNGIGQYIEKWKK
jgi:hypothetical protein